MSAYRSLAPSNQQAADSPASSTLRASGGSSKDTSTRPTSREATRSNDNGGGGDDADKGGGAHEEPVRKRRAPGSVSEHACNECRQARQKCDGEKVPSRQTQTPCSRCRKKNLRCIFEENTKTQKKTLIEELNDVKTHNEELQLNVTNLDSMIQDLQESNDWRGDILKTIGSNGHDREIIQRIREGQSHQEIAEWLRQEISEFRDLPVSPGAPRSLSEVVRIFEADCQDAEGQPPTDGLMLSSRPWTDVSSDSRMISRLLELYFAYVHPVHLLFSERDFIRSFQVNDSIHCSTPLVNAMCAMACYLYENKRVGDSLSFDPETARTTKTLRNGFLDEAKKSLSNAANPKLMTSVQAFAIMYLIDLSTGQAQKALGYLDAALDGLKAMRESPQSNESKELTYWGIRNLKIFCEASTYRKMTFPLPDHGLEFKGINMNADDETGRRYYQPGYDDVQRRPTFSNLTAFHQAKLFRIVEDNLELYRGSPESVTAEAACNQYRRYRAWLQEMAPRLQEVTQMRENDGPLPHVLYLHVQYHTAIVQHLTPIAQSGFFQDSYLHSLRGLVVTHAWNGLELLQSAQRLYTSRFNLPLISFCTIYLGDALLVHSSHLRNDPPERTPSQVLKICLEILQQTKTGFALCGPLQKLLCDRAIEHKVRPPDGMGQILGSFSHYDVDSILGACTRLSFAQPLDRILPRIHSAIAKEWPAAWKAALRGPQGPQRERVVDIASLLNTD